MEPNELIVCRDASLGYEGQSVLAHLDLTIRAGDYLCIVGDNGSGKSTLLKLLANLRVPGQGQILLHGQALRKMSQRNIAQTLAVVEQHADDPKPDRHTAVEILHGDDRG